MGRFPTFYSPVRHFPLNRSQDSRSTCMYEARRQRSSWARIKLSIVRILILINRKVASTHFVFFISTFKRCFRYLSLFKLTGICFRFQLFYFQSSTISFLFIFHTRAFLRSSYFILTHSLFIVNTFVTFLYIIFYIVLTSSAFYLWVKLSLYSIFNFSFRFFIFFISFF